MPAEGFQAHAVGPVALAVRGGRATCLSWAAAALARQGAVVPRLPARWLLVTQFAAGAANHLLPTGLGASAVNLRFLTVHGPTPARASAALALYLVAESTGRLTLLTVSLLAFPGALRLGSLLPEGAGGPLLRGVGAVMCVGAITLTLVRRLRTLVVSFLGTVLDEARTLHRRPCRAPALWGGSLAFPALQAAALVAVGLALDLPVRPAHMAVACLAATVAVAMVPTPGGPGSVEAALIVALVTAGGTAALATSVVLTYRIVTVWLPLVSGVCVLAVLVRLKVI